MGQEAEGNAASLPEAHWRLGQVLDKLGRRPEAIAELNTAVKMNPYLTQQRKTSSASTARVFTLRFNGDRRLACPFVLSS